MPENLSFEEAAGVPTGGLEALHFLRKAEIKSGEAVLINGAGGSIGTIGVQLAKHFGAEVTAVDTGAKLDALTDLGADHVIDYTKQDVTGEGTRYDIIFDIVGKSRYAESIRALKEQGRYLLANPRFGHLIRSVWTSRFSNKQVIAGASSRRREDLQYLKELIESETIKPLVDRVYPIEEVVAAHTYVESGRKTGNVVISIPQD
jgi:NADPH:quinone reductase-like Zn-dependent oxidoreductase